MKLISIGIVGLIAAVCIISCHKSDNNDPSGLSKLDHNFLVSATAANRNEIYLESQIFTHYNIAPEVGAAISYAYNQHRYDQNGLFALAQSFNVTPPDGPDSAHILLWQTLSPLQGHTYDTASATTDINEHNGILDLYQREANFGYNTQVQHYAAEYLAREVFHKQYEESQLAKIQ